MIVTSLPLDHGCTLHTSGVPGRGLVVFLHAFSTGYDTPFMQAVLRALVVTAQMDVVTVEFNYFREKHAVSPGLEEEMKQLVDVLAYAEQLTAGRKLFVVGKSLGGVIALKTLAQTTQVFSVTSVSVLGLPMALGYPPRLELLSGASIEPFDARSEYRHLLSSLHIPLHIIQGGADDLGAMADLHALLDLRPDTVFDHVPGADHGFCVEGVPIYQACTDALVTYVKTHIP